MNFRFPWGVLLLATTLAGCLPPQTAGTPGVGTTPTPSPSLAPEKTATALDITVRNLTLDGAGLNLFEIDAPEAMVVLPLLGTQAYDIRMGEADKAVIPTYRTATKRAFAKAAGPRFSLAKRQVDEAPASYGAETTLRVGDATITAQRAYDGQHCLIYVDARDAEGSASKLQQIGEAFDQSLYPKITQHLGVEPAGRSEDGFNRGENRIVLVMSRESSNTALFKLEDLEPPTDEYPNSNYGKLVYLSPTAPVEKLLPALAYELGIQVYLLRRMETYSRMKGNNLPAGQDPSYLYDEDSDAEFWMLYMMGELAMLASGYSPDSGHRESLQVVGEFLEFPSLYRFSHHSVNGAYDNNDGQMLLMGAYFYGLKPGFAKDLTTVEALGTDALASVFQKDFATLFRDFSLATVLDGLPEVPTRYQIPFVKLHHTYTVGSERFPFAGAGASMGGFTTGNGTNITAMLRSRLQAKTQLGIYADQQREAAVVLFRPSATARFIEE